MAANSSATVQNEAEPLTDELEVAGRTLRLNGRGLCRWGIFRLYRAALHVEEPSTDAQYLIDHRQITSIRLSFLRTLSRQQMERAWEAAFAANFSGEALEALRSRIDQLLEVTTAVQRDDLLAFELIPGEGTRVLFNDRELAVIEGDDFQRAFITLYIGGNPPDRRLREAFLAGS